MALDVTLGDAAQSYIMRTPVLPPDRAHQRLLSAREQSLAKQLANHRAALGARGPDIDAGSGGNFVADLRNRLVSIDAINERRHTCIDREAHRQTAGFYQSCRASIRLGRQQRQALDRDRAQGQDFFIARTMVAITDSKAAADVIRHC